MDHIIEFEMRYDDHRRQLARLNREGWKSSPPRMPPHIRETMAQTLLRLAHWLTPVSPAS